MAGNSDFCLAVCPPGMITTGTRTSDCVACSTSVTGCQTCTVVGTGNTATIVCRVCASGFFLTSSNTCAACTDISANCIQCTSPTACTACSSPRVLSSGVCVLSNCDTTVKNCASCSPGTTCTTCADGFTKDAGVCALPTPPTCTASQVLSKGVCVCPAGTYANNAACVACSDSNCASCSDTTCLQCKKGHFASAAAKACTKCIANCEMCSSATNCIQCSRGFTLRKGVCTSFGNGGPAGLNALEDAFPCDRRCASCTYSTQAQSSTCLTYADGFAFVGGKITKCDSSCKSC